MSAVSAASERTVPSRTAPAARAPHSAACVALLLASCGFLFFYGLDASDLWRNEGLRALIAAEFLRTGNWVVPMLYGEPLFTKPPGMYAAIALCSLPFGEVTTASARLPSALAATVTVFLFYWYFGRQLGRGGGLVAALLLPLMPFYLERATSAEIDMLQAAWTVGAMVFFLRAVEGAEVRGQTEAPRVRKVNHPPLAPHCFFWLAAFLCMAGGVLTKWTTPLFFYGMAVPLLWWRGQLRLLGSRQHLAGLALTGGLCLGWAAAAVSLAGWDLFYGTIEREALQRLSPEAAARPYPWGEALLHPLVLLASTLPLSPLALLTLRPSFYHLWDERGKFLLVALHCWTWPNMLLMSLPVEHAPRHSAPLFPGIAGLAAMVVCKEIGSGFSGKRDACPTKNHSRSFARYLFIGALAAWMLLKVGYVHGVAAQRSAVRQTRAKGELLRELVPVNKILYILRIKDECVMFYYGRQVVRLSSPADLPRAGGAAYCLLLPEEVASWRGGRLEVVRHLTDSQGDAMILVRVTQ